MLKILIIDDNPMDLEGVRDLMDWESLEINVAGIAADGAEGYRKAIELRPDIILTDVDMPKMDGLKMAESIQEHLSSTKFVFMSCFDDFNYIKEAMDLDAFRYVLKPLKLEELTEVIRKIKRVIDQDLENKRVQEDLQQQLQASLPVLHEQFFRDVLYGKWSQEAEAEQQLRLLKTGDKKEPYTVAFLEIDHYDQVYPHFSQDQKYALMNQVKNYLMDVLPDNQTRYVSNHGYNCIVIIFGGGLQTNGIMETLERCKEYLNQKMRLHVTIGISDFTDRLTRISELFYQAEYAVKSKFCGEGNCVIAASDVPLMETAFEYDLQTIKKELTALLENGQQQNVIHFVGKYYRKSGGYTESHVKSFSVSVIHTLQMILSEKNYILKELFGEEFVLWDQLHKFETQAEIKQWVSDLLEAAIHHTNNQENNRHKKVVENIKKFIEDHLGIIESVEQVATAFYFSARYANHIFKQHTGKTIFDFLIHSRIEAAKSMLLEPNAKVYDVSEKVGYENNSYFCSLFKQNTGLTPKQYMNRYGRSS